MLIDILVIILIILASSLILFSITTLRKLNRSIDVLSADMHQLIDSTIPVMNNLQKASEKIANVAEDAEEHMESFNHWLAGTKEKLNELNYKLQEGKTKNPIFSMLKKLNALSKGISAFWNKYQNNH